MKYRFTIGILCVLALAGMPLAASPSYYCYRTSMPVKVDGVLDDAAWRDVPWLICRDFVTAADADLDTRIKLVWDEDNLYAAFRVEEPQVRARLKADEPEPRNLWRDQRRVMYNRESRYLELFLDPEADGRSYVEMHINAHGKINDHWLGQGSRRYDRQDIDLSSRNLHLEWDWPGRQIAVHVRGTLNQNDDRDQGWDVEIALPWSGLEKLKAGPDAPKPGEVWRMLALRAHPGASRRDGGKFWGWPAIEVKDAHQTIRYGLLIFSDHPAILPEHKREVKVPEWKLVWEWTLRKQDPAETVKQARALGFNALATKRQALLDAGKAMGLETYMTIWLSTAPAEHAQVLQAHEQTRDTKEETAKRFQYGGEPLIGWELYQNPAWCYNRPEALTFGKAEIDKAVKAGYTGIALDGIGYRNYYACFCKLCNAGRIAFVQAHPELSKGQAKRAYSRKVLDDFAAGLMAYAREQNPDIKTTCHIYPHLRSDPLYGNEWGVDFCGQTAAWFFDPWWDMDKVKRYAHEIVSYGSARRKGSIGAPLIGVYTMAPFAAHKRPADRVGQEIRLIKQAGARAIQFVELGHILNDPELARAVSRELGGTYHLENNE